MENALDVEMSLGWIIFKKQVEDLYKQLLLEAKVYTHLIINPVDYKSTQGLSDSQI